MKVIPSMQCRRTVHVLVIGLSLILISACASSQQHATSTSQSIPQATVTPGASPSGPKLVLKGNIDCKTGEVQVTGGTLKDGHFQNLDEPFSALAEKGYDRDVLNEMKENLKLCDLVKKDPNVMKEEQGGVATMELRPSLFLEAEIEDSSISFSLSEIKIGTYQSVAAYLAEEKGQKGCERISENCVKCPNKKIYCTGKKK